MNPFEELIRRTLADTLEEQVSADDLLNIVHRKLAEARPLGAAETADQARGWRPRQWAGGARQGFRPLLGVPPPWYPSRVRRLPPIDEKGTRTRADQIGDETRRGVPRREA